jgi:REP element-mobilizing transposase RayT
MRDPAAFHARKRVHLPHWDVPGGTYFVTYCLCDALPGVVVERLRQQRAELERAIARDAAGPTFSEHWRIERSLVVEAEKHLDRGEGVCWLRDPDLARITAETFQVFDRKRYDLLAWVVMPNHVHVVVRLFSDWTIDRVVHSWKSYTSHECNRRLGRRGHFWQEDYFDRSIRDRAHLERAMTYVARNPVKAGLKDWPWMQVSWDRVDGEVAHIIV